MSRRYQITYYHAVKDGKQGPYGVYDEKLREDEVPDDAPVVVLGLHEDAPGTDAYDAHWAAFHAAIDAGRYVRLSRKGNPTAPTMCKNKADAERQFGDAKEEKAGRKRREMRIVNLVNQLNIDYWAWNRRERRALKAKSKRGVIKGIANVVRKRLKAAGYDVIECHIIMHDMDEKVIWDYDLAAESRVPKELHVHLVIKLAKPVRSYHPLDELGEIIGVKPENLIYPEKGRYAWENPMAYMIHAKDEDKHLYGPEEVFTLCGTPYKEIYSENHREWDIGRSIKSKKKTTHDLDWLLDRIRNGKVTKAECHDESGEYWFLYSRHKKACDQAFEVWAEHRAQLEMVAFERGDYAMSTIYIHGASGNGKNLFVDALLAFWKAVYGWDRGKGGSRNSTETWMGEQVMTIDEGTAACMSAADWKLLLDPYNASPLSERFHNRDGMKPRVLIIISSMSPLAFFARTCVLAGENISQMFRRLGNVLAVLDYDEWDGYNYTVQRPVRVPEYTQRVVVRRPYSLGDDAMVECTLPQLNYTFETPEELFIDGETPMFAPWKAAEEIVRDVDYYNGSPIAERDDADAVFRSVWACIKEAFDPSPIPIPVNYEELPPALPKSKASVGLLEVAKREEPVRVLTAGEENDETNTVPGTGVIYSLNGR